MKFGKKISNRSSLWQNKLVVIISFCNFSKGLIVLLLARPQLIKEYCKYDCTSEKYTVLKVHGGT